MIFYVVNGDYTVSYGQPEAVRNIFLPHNCKSMVSASLILPFIMNIGLTHSCPKRRYQGERLLEQGHRMLRTARNGPFSELVIFIQKKHKNLIQYGIN